MVTAYSAGKLQKNREHKFNLTEEQEVGEGTSVYQYLCAYLPFCSCTHPCATEPWTWFEPLITPEGKGADSEIKCVCNRS